MLTAKQIPEFVCFQQKQKMHIFFYGHWSNFNSRIRKNRSCTCNFFLPFFTNLTDGEKKKNKSVRRNEITLGELCSYAACMLGNILVSSNKL